MFDDSVLAAPYRRGVRENRIVAYPKTFKF